MPLILVFIYKTLFSYLSNREQRVGINTVFSEWHNIEILNFEIIQEFEYLKLFLLFSIGSTLRFRSIFLVLYRYSIQSHEIS